MRSELTEAELRVASDFDCDLAAGYPRIMLPAWMFDLTGDGTLGQGAVRDHLSGAGAGGVLDRRLLGAALDCLGADRVHADYGFLTHSGSIAVNRALAAIGHGHVIITSPTIDIVPAFLREFGHLSVTAVDHHPSFEGYDIEPILAAVTPETRGIVLASPDNPSGVTLTSEQIREVTAFAASRDILVVFDQCFATVHLPGAEIAFAPDHADPGAEWITIWDTGKTVGLGHDKLAFLFCSKSAASRLSDRLHVMQFDVPLRSKLLFTTLFEDPRFEEYLAWFRGLLLENRVNLQAALDGAPVRIIAPKTTSFMLVEIDTRAAGLGISEGPYLDLMRQARVGVIPCSVFSEHSGDMFADPEWPCFRLTLAREPALIAEAGRRLRSVFLGEKHPGPEDELVGAHVD